MATKYVAKHNTIPIARIGKEAKTTPKTENSAVNSLKRLVATVGTYALEIYRYSNDPQPVFSNRGTRVVFRPNRIDLV